jgi:hypothetical protein
MEYDAAGAMPFRIVQHRSDRIVEVVYPDTISALDHADYTIQIKQLIDAQTVSWGLLVDQRAHKIDEKLKGKMLALYGYAAKRRMAASARIVGSTLEQLRLNELLRGTELKALVRAFEARGAAYEWLRTTIGPAAPAPTPPPSRPKK